MNFFKGKMALKMGGWVGVYFPLHKGVIKQKMHLKLVHKSFFGRPYCKGSWRILLSIRLFFFPRESSLRFLQRGQATSGFVGIQKTTVQQVPIP